MSQLARLVSGTFAAILVVGLGSIIGGTASGAEPEGGEGQEAAAQLALWESTHAQAPLSERQASASAYEDLDE